METTSPEKYEQKLHEFNINVKYYEYEKIIFDFLSSKFEAMEKMNLNDECLFEDELESKKFNPNKNEVPKSKDPKNKKTKKKSSPKKSENKNIILNKNGKAKKTKIESIDLVDVHNLNIDKEMKKKDINEFFSDKILLNSIINQIKDK